MFHIIISSFGLTRNRRERAPTPHSCLYSSSTQQSLHYQVHLDLDSYETLVPDSRHCKRGLAFFQQQQTPSLSARRKLRSLHALPLSLREISACRASVQGFTSIMAANLFTFCALCSPYLHFPHSTLLTHPFCLHKSLLLAIPLYSLPA
jgi:hypothetical protein